jgi:hypothetical protein
MVIYQYTKFSGEICVWGESQQAALGSRSRLRWGVAAGCVGESQQAALGSRSRLRLYIAWRPSSFLLHTSYVENDFSLFFWE